MTTKRLRPVVISVDGAIDIAQRWGMTEQGLRCVQLAAERTKSTTIAVFMVPYGAVLSNSTGWDLAGFRLYDAVADQPFWTVTDGKIAVFLPVEWPMPF